VQDENISIAKIITRQTLDDELFNKVIAFI